MADISCCAYGEIHSERVRYVIYIGLYSNYIDELLHTSYAFLVTVIVVSVLIQPTTTDCTSEVDDGSGSGSIVVVPVLVEGLTTNSG